MKKFDNRGIIINLHCLKSAIKEVTFDVTIKIKI